METKQGKEIYRWRKITVEPVIGQIKENFGFRQFCLRGLEGARIEINIVSLSHNLKKIWKYRREFGEKCKNVEKIILFCVEIIVIVGQRPLLSRANGTKWSESVAGQNPKDFEFRIRAYWILTAK